MRRSQHSVFADIPDQDAGRYCSIIDAIVVPLIDAVAGAGTAAALGAGIEGVLGATGASLLGGAATGAGIGALGSAITGGDPGQGALLGGITGGALSFAPEVGSALGIGADAAGALTGAAAGTVGSALTGQNPLTGALEGGAGGFLASELSTPAAQGGAGGVPGGGGAPAATGLAEGGVPDLTSAGSALAGPAGSPLDTSGLAASNFSSLGGSPVAAPGAGAAASPTSTAIPGFDVSPKLESPLTSSASGIAPITGPAAASGTASAGPTAGGQLFKDLTGGNVGKLPSDIGSLIENNPGAAVSALGLGYSALSQPNLPSASSQINALEAQANDLSKTGSLLSSYLFNGTLPPGAMAAVNQATAAAKAKIRSSYAAAGLNGSSAEAEALAQVDQGAAGQIFSLADQLLQQGVTTTGLSSKLYESILQSVTANDKELQGAIANFATAAAGGNKGVTLNVGGAHG